MDEGLQAHVLDSDPIGSDVDEQQDLDQLIDEYDGVNEDDMDDFTEDEDSQMDAIENKMKQFQSHWRPPLRGSRYPVMESDLFLDQSE